MSYRQLLRTLLIFSLKNEPLGKGELEKVELLFFRYGVLWLSVVVFYDNLTKIFQKLLGILKIFLSR